jgi:predicted AAA+ superfamily ATPase
MKNTGMIPRKSYESLLEKALNRSPVVSLLGPRQCGFYIFLLAAISASAR